MVLTILSHVMIGASVINMTFSIEDNTDCMSSYKLREWKGAFGVRPIVCFEAWAMIAREAIRKSLQVRHFYWTLYWMRTYQIETEAARHLSTNPKTMRQKVRAMIKLLSATMPRVVRDRIA